MNKIIIYCFAILVMVLSGIAIYFTKSSGKKYAYVLNQKVFEEFNGTKELTQKLSKVEERQRRILDSLAIEITGLEKSGLNKANEKKAFYQKLYNEFIQDNEVQKAEYTEEIWKQINQYLSEYGKMKGYDFIYGANGSGSLMFANNALDISSDVILFINEKYEGK